MSEKKKKKITWTMMKSTPWWTWLFIVACIVLPVTTVGGAIPTVLALLGIMLCIRVSALQAMKTPMKLLSCFGITVMAWGLAYTFVWAMAGL